MHQPDASRSLHVYIYARNTPVKSKAPDQYRVINSGVGTFGIGCNIRAKLRPPVKPRYHLCVIESNLMVWIKFKGNF